MRNIFACLLFAVVLLVGCNKPAPATTTDATADSTAIVTPPPAEFADAKYAAIGKAMQDAMVKGDMDAWLSNFTDNAVYVWNRGDSLAGKPAIEKFWRDRRANVLDSISFSDNIWLPVKVNQPQSVEAPGVWLLSWYQVNAKYKNGKKMSQWIHNDMHFNSEDKIDRAIQYIDMDLVKAAAGK